MRHTKMILFMGLCALLLFALIPSQTETIQIAYTQADTIHSTADPIYPGSFNKTDNDYMFLKCVERNNNSAFASFSPPPLGEHWMIEVTTLYQMFSLDILNGSIFNENLSSVLDRWVLSPSFPAGEYILGAYNTSLYWIDPNFLNIFPVPFFLPQNLTAVDSGLNQALTGTANLQNYVFGNGTALWENWSAYLGGMLDMIPFSLHSIVAAYNGSAPIFISNDTFPFMGNGSADGDILVEAVYLDDGELHFIRESEWDNSTMQWNSRYKLVTPIWELFGAMLEQVLPGTDMSGGGGGGEIPGFTCTALFLGLMIAIGIIYLRKPKQEITI